MPVRSAAVQPRRRYSYSSILPIPKAPGAVLDVGAALPPLAMFPGKYFSKIYQLYRLASSSVPSTKKNNQKPKFKHSVRIPMPYRCGVYIGH